MNKMNLKEFFMLICSVLSFFMFCFLVLLNRIAFILENPNFVFEQEEPIKKWLEMNNELVNFVTFAPLGLSIIFLVIYILFKAKFIEKNEK
ncbi:hypothetical protein [Solibacillus sp. CAU 1738]|uniref:hypothetical protein n=1 Tax=Solibacillus sp. CAU 1738 TaxID=3140363 RepID=UPI0032600545